jgi:hypothetical protein
MIGRNHILEAEVIEQTVLLTNRWTQHRHDPLPAPSPSRNHAPPSLSKYFFNTLSQIQTFAGVIYGPINDGNSEQSFDPDASNVYCRTAKRTLQAKRSFCVTIVGALAGFLWHKRAWVRRVT